MQSFKVCCVCKERKPTSEFVRSARREDGYCNICLICKRVRNIAYRRKRLIKLGQDPALLEARSRHRWKNEQIREALGKNACGKITQMYRSAKSRARKKGLFFDFTLEDLLNLYVEECPILKIKLNWESKGEGVASDSPSLDRIVPSLGYVNGNLWIISHRANTIKSDATPEELIAIANAVLAC